MERKKQFERFTELLDRNTITPDKRLLIFLLSFLASSLILVNDPSSEGLVTIIFLIPFVILLLALSVLVRQQRRDRWRFQERKLFQSRWGTLGIAALGFGLGELIYHYRAWFRYWLDQLWGALRSIDQPEKLVLVSLFLLGVILGFFVVRNWSKNQQDFVTSITAVLGAAFLATILPALAGNRQPAAPVASQPTSTTGAANAGAAPTASASPSSSPSAGASPTAVTPTSTPNLLDPIRTFAFYAFGFTLSGALNLLAFSMLVAHYTRTRSLTSRSVIDFLYGSDKAQAIDLYFVKNFEADPNYAKEKLVAALGAYREVIRKELAKAMNVRMKQIDEAKATSASDSGDSTPICPDVMSPPFDYFELISIKSVQQNSDNQEPPAGSPPVSPPVSPSSDAYEIVFRKLGSNKPGEADGPITPEMFRVAVSMRWLDNLEYVVTAGEYQQSFPYYGSVAGMSLIARRTIVMDRDKYKKFRTGTFAEGKTPSQADQPRGLHEIDYLSYICVPMASSLGKPEEQSLGVLHADTKLFACPRKTLPSGVCRQTDNDAQQDIYRIIIREDNKEERLDEKLHKSLEELDRYACNLYVQNDPIVTYLENMRSVIVPLLELYKKCRTGAINETKTAA